MMVSPQDMEVNQLGLKLEMAIHGGGILETIERELN